MSDDTASEVAKDLFDKAESIEEVLGLFGGFTSMCWDPRPTGEFVSEVAGEGIKQAHRRIKEIIDQGTRNGSDLPA